MKNLFKALISLLFILMPGSLYAQDSYRNLDSAEIKGIYSNHSPIRFYDEDSNRVEEQRSRFCGEYAFKFFQFKFSEVDSVIDISGSIYKEIKNIPGVKAKFFLAILEGDSLNIRKVFPVSKQGDFEVCTDIKKEEQLFFNMNRKEGGNIILSAVTTFYLEELFENR